MFERYTEKARRVISFSRYEASNYGSPYIEAEHLLLGLLRESHALAKRFLGERNVEPEIRAEIERRIKKGFGFRCGDCRKNGPPLGRNRTPTDWHPARRNVACCSNPDCEGPRSGANSRTNRRRADGIPVRKRHC